MDNTDGAPLTAAAPAKELQQGTEIVHEVLIAVDSARLWQALTSDIGSWWSHSFSEQPHAIVLEPRIGGRFMEQFDSEGNGALYGTVNFCQPGRQLSFSGVMGMQGPVINHCTLKLEEAEGGTRLTVSQQILGMVAPNIVQGYSMGWGALLGHLRAFVEEDRTVR